MRLHTADGARKYLTAGDRKAFLGQAERADRQVRTLCMTLAYSGCRLSEALALTAGRVDMAAGVLVIESLKKRRPRVYRAVPVPPPALLEALYRVHGIRERQGRRSKGRGERLWLWSRMTGWLDRVSTLRATVKEVDWCGATPRPRRQTTPRAAQEAPSAHVLAMREH